MRNEIDSLRKYRIKYNYQRFLTLTFDELVKTAGDFLAYVKRKHSEWVKKTSAFNTSTFIAGMINLYTNYKSTGEWDKQGANHNKVLAALATTLRKERAKNKNIPGNPTSSVNKNPATEPGNSTDLRHGNLRMLGRPLSALILVASTSGASFTVGKKKKRVQNGMYMPHPHNHKEWAACRDKYIAD